MTEQTRLEELAYQFWESRGCPHGSPDEDWWLAEEQLSRTGSTTSTVVDESSMESFPASDPPASHLLDEPPANAEEKWSAANKQRE